MSQDRLAELRDSLTREVRMLADRFRALSQARLDGPLPPYSSRADAGWQVAQMLADAAQGVEERFATDPPDWRQIPRLGVFAVGDQIAVTGGDLYGALAAVAAEDAVWTRAGRATAGEVGAVAIERMRALRLAL